MAVMHCRRALSRYRMLAISSLFQIKPTMSTSKGPLKVLTVLILSLVLPGIALAVLIGVFGLVVKLFGHG